jgi:hypothetical protein
MENTIKNKQNITKDFTNDRGEKVHFEILYDSLGRPLRQKQAFYHNDSEYSYCFERYKDDLSGKKLYHITFDSKMKNILSDGLLPKVGGYYGDHWVGLSNVAEIRELLLPGVFFTLDEPVNQWPPKQNVPVIGIDGDTLDPDLVMSDSEIDNSIFYFGRILPDKLKVYFYDGS